MECKIYTGDFLKLTVYLDILILINTLINYFIIRIASLISSYNISFYRGLSAALCSSFFSLYIFAESSSALFTVTVKAVSLIAAIFLCTGKINLKHNLKFTLFFFTANAVFTGILFFFMQDTDFVYINNCFYYININPVSLVVCVMIAWIIITLVSLYSGISTQKECCEFTIFYGGKSVALKGFYDTGFLVKDYLSYRAVMLCGLPQIEDILPENVTWIKIEKDLEKGFDYRKITITD